MAIEDFIPEALRLKQEEIGIQNGRKATKRTLRNRAMAIAFEDAALNEKGIAEAIVNEEPFEVHFNDHNPKGLLSRIRAPFHNVAFDFDNEKSARKAVQQSVGYKRFQSFLNDQGYKAKLEEVKGNAVKAKGKEYCNYDTARIKIEEISPA